MTHIFDIDGTVVEFHTNKWLKGAKELIISLHNDGHQIVFITMRNDGVDVNEEWSAKRTRETILKELTDLDVHYIIIFGCSSPRILHDDNEIQLDKRKTNQIYI